MTRTEMPVTVLKLTGMGSTGSTVLSIVLGNHPDIETVGEVGSIMRSGWISRESLHGIDPKRLSRPHCTCGKRLDVLYVDAPAEACPFWSGVRREWVERADRASIERYPALQDTFELKRGWPRLLYEKRRPSALFRSYAGLTLAFFESIRAASGRSVIVDAGTVPIRTFVLGMIPGIDLYAVHLVRDGRAVIASNRRRVREKSQKGQLTKHRRDARDPMWPRVVRWIALNLVSEWLCLQLGPKKTVRLRYEDFVADPSAAMGRIGSLIGRDLKGVAEAAASGEPMQAGHHIGGNKAKASGTITLGPDTREWKTSLSPTEQRLLWMSMGWLMRRYGYDR